MRFPKTRGLLPLPLFWLLAMVAFWVIVAGLSVMAFVDGYTAALQKGYAEGVRDGIAETKAAEVPHIFPGSNPAGMVAGPTIPISRFSHLRREI